MKKSILSLILLLTLTSAAWADGAVTLNCRSSVNNTRFTEIVGQDVLGDLYMGDAVILEHAENTGANKELVLSLNDASNVDLGSNGTINYSMKDTRTSAVLDRGLCTADLP